MSTSTCTWTQACYSTNNSLFIPPERCTNAFNKGYVLQGLQGTCRVAFSNAALGSTNRLIYYTLIPIGKMVLVYEHSVREWPSGTSSVYKPRFHCTKLHIHSLYPNIHTLNQDLHLHIQFISSSTHLTTRASILFHPSIQPQSCTTPTLSPLLCPLSSSRSTSNSGGCEAWSSARCCATSWLWAGTEVEWWMYWRLMWSHSLV